jgi:thiamine-phosphate pyrophosphorylase
LLLYYITDRCQLGENEPLRRQCLLQKIAEATRCRVDYIQLREKDLTAQQLELLACDVISVIRESSPQHTSEQKPTLLLINSRTDVALASSAGGVHLRAQDISPRDVRDIYSRSAGATDLRLKPVISISCHNPKEVSQAAEQEADLALFAPVFGKKNSRQTATGVEALSEACRQGIPVLALGGVTLENAQSCIDAGARGIASIRLFQKNKIEEVVRTLRQL